MLDFSSTHIFHKRFSLDPKLLQKALARLKNLEKTLARPNIAKTTLARDTSLHTDIHAYPRDTRGNTHSAEGCC